MRAVTTIGVFLLCCILLEPAGAVDTDTNLVSPYFRIKKRENSEHPQELSPELSRLYSVIEEKLKQNYPDIKSEHGRDDFAFECNVKVFPIKHYLKDGITEQPNFNKEIGPDKNGIMFDLELGHVGRPYMGQAVVPQLFVNKFFKVWLAAPHSTRLNRHVYVHLTYPLNADADFIRSIVDIVNHWDEYVPAH
jgi:hypothetical protein